MCNHAVQRWYLDLWNTGELAVAYEIISPAYDPTWIQIPKKGAEQVKHEIRYFRAIFPDLTYEIVDTVQDETKVWVRYRASGTQNGPAWGFAATGRSVAFAGAAIFWLNEAGLIEDRWGAFSFYDILVALEHVPPLWELKEKLC